MSFTIKFWGVRGSVPSPGPETAEVGGNTSCVEVVAGEQRIILDAGTGLRRLGNHLMTRGPVEATVLLSHVHWDHIQGVPFFTPIYVPGTRLRFVSGQGGTPLREALHAQMRRPHFPVDMGDLPSQLAFDELRDKSRLQLGDVSVTLAKANHPDAVHAFRVEHQGRAIVYATDTEHYSCVDQRLVALARDADVLVYDAQYLPDEYAGTIGPTRVGWGHSTWEAGVQLARAAGVGKLVLFHHDPMRTDEGVRAIEALAQDAFGEAVAAREGLEIAVGARASIAAA
ncbi:MAG: MBL fold metallo-hydrolase [Deltaproteobacteria bacterium]|nr:MBL fold metallo-hydrolase [Deltaproteobacteria bacterium]